MRHLKPRSAVMAASTALLLLTGLFVLPRHDVEGATRASSSRPSSFVTSAVSRLERAALEATTTVPPTTAPPTLPPPTLPPATLPPPTLPPPAPMPAPVPVAQPQPQPQAAWSPGDCGGDLPTCCIMMHESGGNPTAVNASTGASGKWQFMYGTWNHYMGYDTAAQAPEWVQDQKAREIWAGGAGAHHWYGNGC